MLLLVSCPKSGTDFLMKGILTNKKLKYSREYFNPIITQKQEIIDNFGSHLECVNIANNKVSQSEIDYYEKSYSVGKENYLAFKLDGFIKPNIDIVCLYRHRRDTFPSTIDEFITAIGESFLLNAYEDDWYKEIQKFLLLHRDTKFFPVLSHTLHWYIMFQKCETYNIPVIDYKNLINSSKEDLDEELRLKLGSYYKPRMVDKLLQLRKNIHKDYDSSLEKIVNEFILFLKTKDFPKSYEDLLT